MTDLDYKELWKQTYDGLDLVMDRFRLVGGHRLPRTISTGATGGRQYSIDRRDTIMTYYKASMFQDCRINAYVDFDALKQKGYISHDYRPRPDHLFVDLDRDSFDTDDQLENALQTTLRNINESITQAHPTTVRSGNGYHAHVYLQWEKALEDMGEFANFADQDLATRFLRWAECELTEGMADKHHNPSIKSCLFRVPGSINSRARDRGLEDPIVRVVDVGSWIYGNHTGSIFPPLGVVKGDFLMKFHSHLVQELIDEKVEKLDRRRKLATGLFKNLSTIAWIDKLMQTPVDDNRKSLLFWVLAPYVITVRGLDYDQAYSMLDAWLDKCNEVRRLEPDRTSFRYRLRYCLDTAEKQERKPIRLDTFRGYYPELYRRLFVYG
jgi:hypothetical protein